MQHRERSEISTVSPELGVATLRSIGYTHFMPSNREDEAIGHPDLTKRLACLAAFLPIFEDAAFQFGSWVGGKPMPHGLLHVPSFVMSDAAEAFVKTTYEMGWVLPEADWVTWKGSAEAGELASRPEALARATPEQLAKLLTVLIRQDRFVEGSLAEAFESGFLVAITRRAAALLREIPRKTA